LQIHEKKENAMLTLSGKDPRFGSDHKTPTPPTQQSCQNQFPTKIEETQEKKNN
jgi:hypothetical protein